MLFSKLVKHPKKLPNATKTLKKLPKIAQNFYIFVKSTQKSSRKAPEFLKNTTELFRFCQKYPKKLPKSSRILERFQSGDSSGVEYEYNGAGTAEYENRVILILDLVITNTSTCSQNITSTDTIQKTPDLKDLDEF